MVHTLVRGFAAVGLLGALLFSSRGWAADGSEGTVEASSLLTRPRYAYLGSGLLFVTGVVLAYSANGQALRAETITSAREATRALDDARQAALGANLCYAAAGLTLGYALVLEFLPEPAAERARLTFHF